MAASKTVLITGTSRGIGLGLVKEYVSRGCQVIATCRNPTKATELNDFLLANGQPSALPLDVASLESIKACKEAVEKEYQSLDILVNNAGMSNKNHPDDPATSTSMEEFNEIMHNNVTSVLSMTQAFLPLLQQGQQAKVINISSLLGSMGSSSRFSTTSYQCSKAALNMLTKCFAEEVKDVVFVAMHPGWVQTDMGSAKNRKPPVSIEESAKGIVATADGVSAQDSGIFIGFNGSTIPY